MTINQFIDELATMKGEFHLQGTLIKHNVYRCDNQILACLLNAVRQHKGMVPCSNMNVAKMARNLGMTEDDAMMVAEAADGITSTHNKNLRARMLAAVGLDERSEPPREPPTPKKAAFPESLFD